MKRRLFLRGGLAVCAGIPIVAAMKRGGIEEAVETLAQAVRAEQLKAAVLHVNQREMTFTRSFGKGVADDAMFLLGSISKPIAMTALMTLFDRGEFSLDDPLRKFIPEFKGENRELVTMQHLLTHVSGLPDQLSGNDVLRRKHAPLAEFVEHAIRTPLHFLPGSKYQYSSMAILLAARVAEIVSGTEIREFVDRAVFQPLKMRRSAQGLGRFQFEDMTPVQTEHAAPEAGGGDPNAREWDWNSRYWRQLGAPWGGTHASAPDIGRFLAEFLEPAGAVVKAETARLMVRNHNGPGLTPRGLGLNVGLAAGSTGCSDRAFGHTGSTGTIAWADPATSAICVVLTSLPAQAKQPHPRDLAANAVAKSVV